MKQNDFHSSDIDLFTLTRYLNCLAKYSSACAGSIPARDKFLCGLHIHIIVVSGLAVC